jgi:hypothetical protein
VFQIAKNVGRINPEILKKKKALESIQGAVASQK